jgi:coenzyme Q-binding protein COQ10
MPVFKTSKRVAVGADVAFSVAADVARYKEFLPLLQRSTIRGGKQDTDAGQRFDAELAIAYDKLGLRESFISTVDTHTVDRRVVATSQDGPFRNLKAQWTITPAVQGCDVAIEIDYAFKNVLLQMAAGGVMNFAVEKVMAAFEARARDIQRSASISS